MSEIKEIVQQAVHGIILVISQINDVYVKIILVNILIILKLHIR